MANVEASRGLSYQNHIGHIPYDILGNNGPGMIFVFFVLVSMLVVTVCWCVVKCYVLAEMESSSNEDYNRYRQIKEGKLSTSNSHNDDDVIDVDVIPGSIGNRNYEITIAEAEKLSPPEIISSPNFHIYPYSINGMRETCLHDYPQHHDEYLSDHLIHDNFQSQAFLSNSHPSLPVPSFSSSYHFTPV